MQNPLNLEIPGVTQKELKMFEGTFSTKIATKDTTVRFKIYESYKVKAKFNSHGDSYTFNMNHWMKSKDNLKNATSSYNKFSRLVLERYGDTTEDFGGLVRVHSGAANDPFVPFQSQPQILNMLKYACYDVFVCAEEIITSYRRALLSYCIYQREKMNGEAVTYEQYIHSVACHCLVQSNYLAPATKFDEVEFCVVPRDYSTKIMQKIYKNKDKTEED